MSSPIGLLARAGYRTVWNDFVVGVGRYAATAAARRRKTWTVHVLTGRRCALRRPRRLSAGAFHGSLRSGIGIPPLLHALVFRLQRTTVGTSPFSGVRPCDGGAGRSLHCLPARDGVQLRAECGGRVDGVVDVIAVRRSPLTGRGALGVWLARRNSRARRWSAVRRTRKVKYLVGKCSDTRGNNLDLLHETALGHVVPMDVHPDPNLVGLGNPQLADGYTTEVLDTPLASRGIPLPCPASSGLRPNCPPAAVWKR